LIRFFDVDSLQIRKNSSGGTAIFRAAVSHDDGNTILTSDGLSISRWNVDKEQVDDVHFEGDSERLVGIQSVSISPDGRLVATATGNQQIIVWEAESRKILGAPLEGHTDDICALNFSADSRMVVSGSDDQKVWIWSVDTKESQRESQGGPMEGHTDGVTAVCFRCILTCCEFEDGI
jgi:WD40 repeat protein